MIIKEMTATFGRLERARLELKDGLNVIQAPNEAGKSTWCAFLRAMFYGIPTRDRDRKGYLADKNRYQPWSGAPMEGEVRLIWQGQDITLRRFAKGSVPFGGFSAVYTATQEPVPGLTAQTCGPMLLGVGREVWERSAFVGQAPTLAIDGTPELERRIAALISSGQEEVSYSQTQARLSQWLRLRQHNRTGLIPRLEEELTQVTARLDHMEQINRRLTQAQADRLRLEGQLRELEGELHIHRRLAQRDLNRRYAQARQVWQDTQLELDRLRQDQEKYGQLPHRSLLKQAQGQLQYLNLLDDELRRARQEAEQTAQAALEAARAAEDPRFPQQTGEQAVLRARDDRRQAEAILEQYRRSRRRSWLLALPGLVLGGGLTAAGWLLKGTLFPYLWSGLGLCGAVTILISILANRRNKARWAQACSILQRYHADAPEEITALAESFRRREEEARRADADNCRAQEELCRLQTRRSTTQQDLMDFVHLFAPEVSDLFGCSAALSRALNLEDKLSDCTRRLELARSRYEDLRAQGGQELDTLELLHAPDRTQAQTQAALDRVRVELASANDRLAMARGELRSLGDPTRLDAEKEDLERQLERRRTEHRALTLALDCLAQANTQMQERFAPQLNQLAGQILSQLTGGRYESLALDRQFEAAARSQDSLLPHSALALSRGTADQIYLAVRLAVCRLCLPQDERSPLVLDDALLTFDAQRMALALELLAGMEQQVLLFSCQERESIYAAGLDGVNILCLHS